MAMVRNRGHERRARLMVMLFASSLTGACGKSSSPTVPLPDGGMPDGSTPVGSVCALPVAAWEIPPTTSAGGLVPVRVRLSLTAAQVTASLSNVNGRSFGSVTLRAEGEVMVGELDGPPGEGLYVLTIAAAGQSDGGCSQRHAYWPLFLDEPARQFAGLVITKGGLVRYVNEPRKRDVTMDEAAAFTLLGQNLWKLDALLKEDEVPYLEECAEATITPCMAGCSVGSAVQPLPPGFDKNPDAGWKGTNKGGCGVWATLMCNRILGVDGEGDGKLSEPADKDEWNKTACGDDRNGDHDTQDPGETAGVDEDGDGATTMSDEARYYRQRGYGVSLSDFGGSASDYADLKEAKDRGCDVKLVFAGYHTFPDGHREHFSGHVETVTDVDTQTNTATTNSWGQSAQVSGGSNGGFSHSEADGMGHDNFRQNTWPRDSTQVYVQKICP
jgi:hypothetical protein